MTTIPGGRKVENKFLEKFPDCKITHFVHTVDEMVETVEGRWKKVTKKVITFEIQSTHSNGEGVTEMDARNKRRLKLKKYWDFERNNGAKSNLKIMEVLISFR